MAMSASFFELALEESAVFAVTPLDREGSFAEVVTQVGIASASQVAFFRLKFSLTGLAPFEPGEFGDLGFIAVEALNPADLGHNTGDQD